MSWRHARGFTLVEVLVALMIVALGLSALMVAVSGTARTTGYLRDKTLAQWIALNRLSEVRLNVNKAGQSPPAVRSTLSTPTTQNTNTTEIKFANRTWHYDTRYFDTSITSMKRIVVRVWAGDVKTKGNPVAEATSFYGTTLATPGGSNVDWTQGSTATAATGQPTALGSSLAAPAGGSLGTTTSTTLTPSTPPPTPPTDPDD